MTRHVAQRGAAGLGTLQIDTALASFLSTGQDGGGQAPPSPPVYQWNGGNGSFSDALKWTLASNHKVHAVPGASDVADFAKGGTISGDGSVFEITIEAGVTFTGDISASSTLAGVVLTGGLTLDGGATLSVTDIITGGASTLAFKAGSVVDAGAGANGIPAGDVGLDIGGGKGNFADCTINSTGLIGIGNSADGVAGAGTATVTASGGAKVYASYTGLAGAGGISSTESDRGTLILEGSGTVWSNTGTAGGAGASGGMLVGVEGRAALVVESGATLLDNTYGDIGSSSTASGVAQVTGVGSTWSSVNGLYVGDGGSGTLTVSLGGTVSSGGGAIGNQGGSTGVVNVTGNGSNWQDSLFLTIGYEGAGTLSIVKGGLVSIGSALNLSQGAALLMGDVAGSSGKLIMDGAGSMLAVNGQVDIGIDGNALLSIADGAVMTSGDASGTTASGLVLGFNSDGAGTLKVSGVGSSLTNTGIFQVDSNSAVNISGGATLSTSINPSLGYDGADIGYVGKDSVNVSGVGSRFNVATLLVVGVDSSGLLNVSSGATASLGAGYNPADSAVLYEGYYTGSTGVVDVAGSGARLTVAGQADIGISGSGKLSVGAGGAVTTGDISNATDSGLVAGYETGSVANVTVSGAGASLTNNGIFDIASSGDAVLNVSDGGTVSTSIAGSFGQDGADIGLFSGSRGNATVQGAGSAWKIGSNLGVGFEGIGTLVDTDSAHVTVGTNLVVGVLDHGNGSVAVQGEAFMSANGITTLGDEQGAKGTLAVSGSATVNGKLVQSDFAYGTQLVVGYQGSGTLSVDLGGLVAPLSGVAGEIDVGLGTGGHGSVVVDGANSQLQGASMYLGETGGAGGSAAVTISDGGVISVSGSVQVAHGGTITLSAGVLNAAEISFVGGVAVGNGTLNAPTIDGGALTASGGTLALTGTVNGGAALTVDNNATLALGGAVATAAKIIFGGATGATVSLSDPQLVHGLFEDFVKGDTIDLLNVAVTGHTYTPGSGNGTLSLALSNGDYAKLLFSGSYDLGSFAFGSDGHGGTDITHR